MTKPLPSPELLRKLLRYEPSTGLLFWRPRPPSFFNKSGRFSPDHKANNWNAKYAGKPALNSNFHGYLAGSIKSLGMGKAYAHRVAWAIHYGQWPVAHIDHINHDRSDNRIKNLRDVTRAENNKNASMKKNNTSGVTGVYWHKQSGKWVAHIRDGRGIRYLGSFEKIEDAAKSRWEAEKTLNFHPNHGKSPCQ